MAKRALLHDQIYETLKKQIMSGFFQRGEMIPTEQELVKQFGVSRTTTNRALKRLMQEGWVVRRAGAGTFVRQISASKDRDTSSSQADSPAEDFVGLIIPFIRDEYGLAILTETERLLHASGMSLAVAQSYGKQAEEQNVIERLHRLGAKGLIIFPADDIYYNDSILKMYVERLPMVIIDKPMPGMPLPLVMSDHTLGAKMLTDHLLGLGHEHIAFLSPPFTGVSPHQLRLQGYQEALQKAGLPFREDHCLTLDWTGKIKDDESAAQRLMPLKIFLQDHPEVTAVFATQYRLAQYMHEVAKEMDISVPGDLSLACFDGPRVRNVEWQFTHIAQDEKSIAHRAVHILLKLLAGESVSVETIYIPPGLRQGFSTSAI